MSRYDELRAMREERYAAIRELHARQPQPRPRDTLAPSRDTSPGQDWSQCPVCAARRAADPAKKRRQRTKRD